MKVDLDPDKLTRLHDALGRMLEFWHSLPAHVRRPYVGMRDNVVPEFTAEFGPWIESAPDHELRIEPALRAVGIDPDDDEMLIDVAVLEARIEIERRRADAWRHEAERLRTELEAM